MVTLVLEPIRVAVVRVVVLHVLALHVVVVVVHVLVSVVHGAGLSDGWLLDGSRKPE